MESTSRDSHPSDPNVEGRRLFRVGGASMLMVATLFLLLIGLGLDLSSSASGPLGFLLPPGTVTPSAVAQFGRMAEIARVNFGLGILSDIFLVPAVVALYEAFKKFDRDAMLLAVPFFGLYLVVDLTVSGFDLAALVSLSQGVSASSVPPTTLGIVSYVRDLTLVSIPISSGLLSLGILFSGFALRKSGWPRGFGYLSTFTAVAGFVYAMTPLLPALYGFLLISALLEFVWFTVVGLRLYR